jgi:hypothetical protein
MLLYEEIVKAGWAKDSNEALLLLLKCLVAVNDNAFAELEDFDMELNPGDTLTLYKPNPKALNAFNVDKLKTYKVDGVKSERTSDKT